MNRFVIITAGGTGTRMKSGIPKQFLLLGDLPILMHTIKRFYEFDKMMQIILSLPENYIEFWNQLCKKYDFKIKHRIIKGGNTRFQSIKNSLFSINSNTGVIAVHDGVRPSVNSETIKRCFEIAENKGNAVPYCDIVFSVREVKNGKNYAADRNSFKEIQTPQVFNLKYLKDAYAVDFKEQFTDDASVFEAAGHQINLVKGNRENIKITSAEDLIIAEALLNRIL